MNIYDLDGRFIRKTIDFTKEKYIIDKIDDNYYLVKSSLYRGCYALYPETRLFNKAILTKLLKKKG